MKTNKIQYIEIHSNGNKYYYSDKKLTKLHREDGPAVVCWDGTKKWFINNNLHREDGPAVVWSGGRESWYLNNINVSQEEHARLTRKVPTININGKDFTVEELNSLIERTNEYSVPF